MDSLCAVERNTEQAIRTLLNQQIRDVHMYVQKGMIQTYFFVVKNKKKCSFES